MKVIYDTKTDTLTVIFTDMPVAESDEDIPGSGTRLAPGGWDRTR